ncbi:hypothetical protein Taro_056529, partial [Colocasia esculenta]|nr:hypothetical protein [Colocasia esculenta]
LAARSLVYLQCVPKLDPPVALCRRTHTQEYEAGVSPLPPAFFRVAEKSTVLCMEYLAAYFPGLVPLWAMLAGLLVEVAEEAISVVPILEVVLVTDSDPEGDLMWWQCQQPPCLLHSEMAWIVLPHFKQYAEFVPYRNGSHMPLRYHHGFTAIQVAQPVSRPRSIETPPPGERLQTWLP